MTDYDVKPGDIIKNDDVVRLFKVANTGGMRKNNEHNTLVLIADHTKSTYDDRWVENIFHYTGMGMEGDQSITHAQNKTLAESNTNGVTTYLFEVFRPNEYLFQGRVMLESDPYTEQQPDSKNNIRNVFIFPLKLVSNNEPVPVDANLTRELREKKEKLIRKLTNEELLKRIEYCPKKPGKRRTAAIQYERNQFIVEYVKRNANGTCKLCEQPAPFNNANGEPYLEIHHVHWLSEDGDDSVENTVALCPNCHKKMHILNLDKDKEKLVSKH